MAGGSPWLRCPRTAAMLLPVEAQSLHAAFLPHFTSPTYTRFVTLAAAAILTTGRRTVANLLRTVGDLAPGHDASYRRVLSSAEWSGLELGCALTRFLLTHVVPDGAVDLVGDDTVDGHPGVKVYGKGRHRDAVRSSHSYTAWRYGHTWVVLAVLVRFPFAARRWALPVLVDSVPHPRGQPSRGHPAPDPGPADVPLAPARPPPVPGPDLRIRRGCRVRHPRGGPVLPPAPPAADAGQQVPPGRQPVRPAPALPGNRAAAGEGGPPAQAPAGGRDGPAAEAHRGLVRGWNPPGRDGHRDRALVQGRERAGADPVGVREGHDRHPPGRVPVHHRHRPGRPTR